MKLEEALHKVGMTQKEFELIKTEMHLESCIDTFRKTIDIPFAVRVRNGRSYLEYKNPFFFKRKKRAELDTKMESLCNELQDILDKNDQIPSSYSFNYSYVVSISKGFYCSSSRSSSSHDYLMHKYRRVNQLRLKMS